MRTGEQKKEAFDESGIIAQHRSVFLDKKENLRFHPLFKLIEWKKAILVLLWMKFYIRSRLWENFNVVKSNGEPSLLGGSTGPG